MSCTDRHCMLRLPSATTSTLATNDGCNCLMPLPVEAWREIAALRADLARAEAVVEAAREADEWHEAALMGDAGAQRERGAAMSRMHSALAALDRAKEPAR